MQNRFAGVPVGQHVFEFAGEDMRAADGFGQRADALAGQRGLQQHVEFAAQQSRLDVDLYAVGAAGNGFAADIDPALRGVHFEMAQHVVRGQVLRLLRTPAALEVGG